MLNNKASIENIEVGRAGKVGEGVHAHFVYAITTTFVSKATTVQDRRYSDFVWLQEQLAKEVPGAIIPPLPEKVVNVLQGQQFLERRRNGLELFLTEVRQHNTLKKTRAIQQFLTLNQVDFTAAKAAPDTNIASTQKALTSWFGKTYQRISENEKVKSLAAKAGKEIVVTKTGQDVEFDGEYEYVANLLSQLKNLEARVQTVRKNGQTMAISLYEMAASVSVLSESESKEAHMKDANLNGIEPILKEHARQLETEYEIFYDQVTYFTRYVSSAMQALGLREDRRFAYQSAKAHVKKLMESEDCPGHQLTEAHRQVDTAKADFDRVHERVILELQEFKLKKSCQLRKIFADFAEFFAIYNTEMVKVLAMAIPVARIDEEELREQTKAFGPTAATSISQVKENVPKFPNNENSAFVPLSQDHSVEKTFEDIAL